MVIGIGTALADKTKEPKRELDLELVFKGDFVSQYVIKDSILFASTKSGADLNKIAALIKFEYTPDGIRDRINSYKKSHSGSNKYDNFAFSLNGFIFDLKNKKYTMISFTDYDMSGKIISDTFKDPGPHDWFNMSPSQNYTLQVIEKYVSLNHDKVLSRSGYKKTSE